MLMRKHLYCLLATAIALLSDYGYADELAHSQQWANDYYRSNTACTVASIANVRLSPLQVTVTLDVEPATAAALSTSGTQHRDNWMALHCPPENHQAWKQNSPDFDVTVIAALASLGHYEFSCASHHIFTRQKQKDTVASVLSKLRKRLTNSTAD